MPTGRLLSILLLTLAATSVACGGADAPQPAPEPSPPVSSEAPAAAPTLDPPFSAEQIRDTCIVGLTIDVRLSDAQGDSLQRWTVVESGPEAVAFEYADLDGAGEVVGDPVVERASWNELRDHAVFPSAIATRERATRETALGTLDGWLYVVGEPQRGAVSEFFFADSLPGAPVWMQVTLDGAVVQTMSQETRHSPA